MSLAQRIDAADGVIDGKYYGRPIIETGVRTIPTTSYRTTTAAALDAADGVIDGRYYGRPIIEATSGYVSPARRYYGSRVTRPVTAYAPAAAVTTSYAPTTTYAAPTYTSTALALDAADGVIDGRYYGRPIIEATSGYPIRRYGAASVTRVAPYAASVTRYGGYPRYYDDAAVTYGARRYVDDYPYYGRRYAYDDLAYTRPVTGYRSGTALALDAADGVIDGRYYGRPIVEAPVTRRYGLTAAERLDAADGVIDGRFYGRRIVQK